MSARFLILLLLAATPLPRLASAEVVIHEVHHDPPDGRANEEFIELHNAGAEPVDLAGWRLSGGIDYRIPEGTAPLEPSAFLVVALDPAADLFSGVPVLGPWDGRLDSEGEQILLRDAAGIVVDAVDFAVRFPWPIAPGGDGPSMELLEPGLDNDLGSSWRPSNGSPTPGLPNSVHTPNAPPNIRQVDHAPRQPAPGEEATVSVKITDPDGVANVVLHYQIVEPGKYIPAYQPYSLSSMLQDPEKPRRFFGGYAESLFTGRWPTISMTALDADGTDEDPGNDGRFVATLPAQGHRTLVRYYITAEDGLGNSVRAPLEDDPSLNFAYFTYGGVPAWSAETDSSQGAGHVYSPEVLQQLPVYHLLTRNEDWMQCLAYSSADQLPRSSMSARSAYNWSGTIVYDGIVYDNIAYRLRGGNGRYHLRGKRSMKFRFNRGSHFEVKDNRGRPYERKWRILTTSKMFGNRTAGTFGTRDRPGNFGLVDTVNGRLWELFGVPAVRAHWFHFRVIDDVEEAPDQYGGDFYGLNLGLERIDVRFLESRGLPKGNLYKLTDQSENYGGVGGKGSASDGKKQQRYQAPGAPQNAEDYVNIFSQLRPSRDDDWLRRHVNWDIWYRYTAVEEAIRHYDYWPDADKNMVYYFEPQPGNDLGLYWQLPYDSDASWGPSWNEGIDLPQQAVARKDDFQVELRNVVREFRDLVWQPGVIEPLIRDAAAVIEDFHPADWDRWRAAPSALGSEDFGTLASKVDDMMLFAFEGGLNYPGGSVGPGGRAAFLDAMAEDRAIPKTPEIRFEATSGHAVDALRFTSSAYGPASIFAPSELNRVEWRIGEVTDAAAPAYDAMEERIYEITKVWGADTGENLAVDVPAGLLKVGHAYRARVRHWDITGRASHWSDPHAFVAEAPRAWDTLRESLVLTELMYHPGAPDEAEAAAGYDESDFEFVEFWNRGSEPLDLTEVRFTKGIDFDFPAGTLLAAGARLLVVAREDAMAFRYGEGLPVAGEWDAGFSLSNGGERLKLSFGAGNALFDFRYGDSDPWPAMSDGAGHSLVLRQDGLGAGLPDYAQAGGWAASARAGGSPGTADEAETGGGGPQPGESLADWLSARGLSDPQADPDGDGITHFGVYAMAADLLGDGKPAARALPALRRDGEGRPEMVVRMRAGAGVQAGLQSSDDLREWEGVDLEASSIIPVAGGAVEAVYRLSESAGRYWRVRFVVEP